MRRTRVALLASLIWLAATAAAFTVVAVVGPSAAGYSLAALCCAAGLAGSLWSGRAAEERFAEKLGQLGKAVGLAGAESRSVEAIVANLCARLDRANQFKSAFTGLRQPALLLSADGEILGASAGLTRLEPRAVEGGTADLLFGEGFLASGGGVAEEGLMVAGGQRFDAVRRAAGAGRLLLELTPAGHYISDDDLDAFATALAGGHTSFRFDPRARQNSPALRSLEQGLESFDLGARALAQMLAGEELDPVFLRSNSGFAPQVRQLSDTINALADERDEAAAERDLLERKMQAVLHAIDRYRATVATMAEIADRSRTGLAVATAAVHRGRDKVRSARVLQRDAVVLASDAVLAAERANIAADGVDAATLQIDKLVAAVEDVSFRTNLLALNAAVEAARAGEKGAGFAVVADEVRTLAQSAQKTARDIRALVSSTRAQSEAGIAEAGVLRNILSGLGRHLENLSNETDMIAAALDEGSGAISRLDTHVDAVGSEAARALLLPRRKSA